MPSVSTVAELYETIYGKPPSGIALQTLKALAAIDSNWCTPLLLHPGTPQSIVTTYWDAAEKMVTDAQFRKMADSLVGASKWSVGEAFQNEFRLNYGISPEVKGWLKPPRSAGGVSL